jgi:hypothetical protein
MSKFASNPIATLSTVWAHFGTKWSSLGVFTFDDWFCSRYFTLFVLNWCLFICMFWLLNRLLQLCEFLDDCERINVHVCDVVLFVKRQWLILFAHLCYYI